MPDKSRKSIDGDHDGGVVELEKRQDANSSLVVGSSSVEFELDGYDMTLTGGGFTPSFQQRSFDTMSSLTFAQLAPSFTGYGHPITLNLKLSPPSLAASTRQSSSGGRELSSIESLWEAFGASQKSKKRSYSGEDMGVKEDEGGCTLSPRKRRRIPRTRRIEDRNGDGKSWKQGSSSINMEVHVMEPIQRPQADLGCVSEDPEVIEQIDPLGGTGYGSVQTAHPGLSQSSQLVLRQKPVVM